LVALGILWLARVLTVRPRRRLYPGFLILMLGLFYLGVEWDLVELSRATLVTALILIAGLAVFPSFLLGKKSLPFLANGVVLTITGILFWLYVDMDFPSFYYLETYWPVALVIIGAAYLLQATLSGRKPLNN
ncbi:MAG: hypothetical protein KDI06_19780, partial [Calditrichaeota bacterium]|nr:hypothetical protein [Calditrichota bacterium]